MPSAVPSAESPRSSRPCPSSVYRNREGDLVEPAAIGEVVLLPRLWGFDFAVGPDGAIRIENAAGLTVRADLTEEGAVRLSAAADGVAAEESSLSAAS